MSQLYYCEVCFAVPLPQSFTYIYYPKPAQPVAESPAQKKTKKTRADSSGLKVFTGSGMARTVLQEVPQESLQELAPEPGEKLLLPQLGQRVFASFGRSHKEGWIISAAEEAPQSLVQVLAEGKLQLGDLKELEIAEPLPLFGTDELRLARWLAKYYICSLGEALSCILPTGKKEKEPLLYEQKSGETPQPLHLSAEQEQVIEAICPRDVAAEQARPFYYLFGPTGSGKTEVFLQCMERVLAAGKSVIYLVPEISLCYQLQEQLQSRFSQPVALLHSHLSAEQRLWYWRSLQQGSCSIVLGARSAVFAPVVQLGMIVLDEEHELSYKAGDTPRYHARQVAMRRCRDHAAILLMGSATPSVEAIHASHCFAGLPECKLVNSPDSAGRPTGEETENLKEGPPDVAVDMPEIVKKVLRDAPGLGEGGSQVSGKRAVVPAQNTEAQKDGGRQSIQLLRLSKRLAGGSFPTVEIVDLRRSKTMLSKQLVCEIESVTQRGEQAILFLNRRGYSPIIECFACGKVQECRHCSVALTYHKKLQRLKCHHCGFSMPMPSGCMHCHQAQLEFIGFGTEQIEEELERTFSHLRVARLDTDISQKKGQSKKILEEFRKGALDLLVGTQMVAKGLNFEGVKLVGVVLADTSINMPDFRAAERSFSLLVQVAGRAGRFSHGGKVLVQTYQPESAVVQQAAALDWQGFYAKELELRSLTHYPPFSRMIRLVFRGTQKGKVWEEAQLWYRNLQSALVEKQEARAKDGRPWEIFAPCECPYFRVANKYRYHILLRSMGGKAFTLLHQCVHQYYWQTKRQPRIYIEVDVDPSTMM